MKHCVFEIRGLREGEGEVAHKNQGVGREIEEENARS